jgi:thioredoxin reductase
MSPSDTSPRPAEFHDYLIIGAGPAGLQLGYYLEQSGRDYLLLDEAERVGSFFEKFPRSRGLISFNKFRSIYKDPEIQLRWDWNSLLTEDYSFPFKDYSKELYPKADDMVRYLQGFAERFQLKVRLRARVTRVSKGEDGLFRVRDAEGRTWSSRCVVVATGPRVPHVPDIPGIEHAEGYESASFEQEDYEDKRVLIIGKGNSGFELADAILSSASLIHLASPHPVQLAWKTRHPGHLRSQYARILDTYQLKTLNGALDCDIHRIEKREDGTYKVVLIYVHADGEEEHLVYDKIVRATGFCFDTSIFDEACRPPLMQEERFPEMTSAWESTTTSGLYFAGTLMQVRDFRVSSSAFIDGFRYNIRTLFHLLEARYHQKPLPGHELELTNDALADAVMERVCRSSALWTQFGFLCDAVVVDEATSRARYFLDLPVDYVREGGLGENAHYYTVTFEWGQWDGDVFAITRHPSADMAYTNVFLHPIVRRYRDRELVSEHHILEDLFGMYRHEGETGIVERRSGRDMKTYHLEEHDRPLRAWFTAQLAAAGNSKAA